VKALAGRPIIMSIIEDLKDIDYLKLRVAQLEATNDYLMKMIQEKRELMPMTFNCCVNCSKKLDFSLFKNSQTYKPNNSD
jgi:hypothetical protein